MYRIIKASAHKTGLPDQSVDLIVTSPPYWSMRIYEGDQMIEWPTVSYSPMPGLSPITITGCAPNCAHEWIDGPTKTISPQQDHSGDIRTGQRGGQGWTNGSAGTIKQGAYCQKCGGWRGGLGSEPTPTAYVGHLILVSREMWRVLKPTGLFWCNIGDTYAGYWGDQGAKDEGRASAADKPGFSMNDRPSFDSLRSSGLKPKDMIMIPEMAAFALRADGWFLRAKCYWLKRNCLPESTVSRPTTVIESIFMLAKEERHFYDYVAVQMPVAQSSVGRLSQDIENQIGSSRANGGEKTNGNIKAGGSIENGRRRRTSDWFFESWQGLLHDDEGEPLAFVVNPKGFKAAHFATFPEKLVEPMILSGSSAYGVCPKCGSPWIRIVEKSREHGLAEEAFPKTDGLEKQNGHKRLHQRIKAARAAGEDHDNPLGGSVTLGWEPSCSCDSDNPVPATILDPFCGSGTTLRCAVALGRDAIGVDLSDEYLEELVPKRVDNTQIKMQF